MTTTSPDDLPAEGAAPAEEAVAHADNPDHVGYATYVRIWASLIGLTTLTVLASYANLRHLATLVAILIAVVKSSLVLLYFMHLRFEKRVFAWMFLSALGAYAIFIILTFADYSYR